MSLSDEPTRPDTSPRAAFTGPKRIAGYRVLRELGSGGMGTVFEAFDERMNRRVALKVLSRHLSSSERSGKRFEQEAWIAGKLDHPNLVKVYDRGSWEELSFHAMELVDGGSLHDVIQNMRRWGRDDRLGLEFGSRDYLTWAIGKVIEAARGLEYAHRHGVTHRDVKPMNLLLGLELGTIKIADFGLAIDADTPRMTTEGKMLGTLAYMAPEQVLGKRDKIGPGTDIYALGVTLFELLTLELPYIAETQELYLNAVLTGEARRPRKLNARVSSDLETVIRTALEKEPRHRYVSAAAFADDLENVIHLRPIRARRPGAWSRTAKWVRRKPVHAGLVAALLLGIPTIGVLGTQYLRHRQVERQARVAGLLERAGWLLQRARYDDAEAAAREVLELSPTHRGARAYLALGPARRYHYLIERDKAEAEGVALRELALERGAALVRDFPHDATAHATFAYVLDLIDMDERAREERSKADSLRSSDLSTTDLLVAGRLALNGADYPRAVELFTELVHRQSDNTTAIADLGYAFEALGDPVKARENLRLALAANPGLRFVRIDLAQLEAKQGNLAEGERWVRDELKLDPDSAVAWETLSDNLLAQGQRALAERREDDALAKFRDGESAARRALELKPTLAFAAINLGALLLEQNRLAPTPRPELLAEAVQRLDSVLQKRSHAPEGVPDEAYANALANRCDALIQTGDLNRALGACSRFTEEYPDDPIGFYNLAGVYAQLGRDDDALTALGRDVELGDTDGGYLEADEWFSGLRDDTRFRELIARMKSAESAPSN